MPLRNKHDAQSCDTSMNSPESDHESHNLTEYLSQKIKDIKHNMNHVAEEFDKFVEDEPPISNYNPETGMPKK